MNEAKHTLGNHSGPVLQCLGLSKVFSEGGQSLTVLDNVDFSLLRGQRVAVVGASGAGKSTLLHIMGGLDNPTSGEVRVAGFQLSQMRDAERGRLRNRFMGFVYQFHHLLPEFTALENVAMPLLIRGESAPVAAHRATALLDRVGLGARLTHKPGKLSGGERQRAAVARALITEPACVFADEPTGNLDRQSAERVFGLMLELNASLGTSFVVVTHDQRLARQLDATWSLDDGKLIRQR
jgi:lipoprotein-releasing system ATP-binding protein